MPKEIELIDLPLAVKELIYRYLSFQDLMTLRDFHPTFADHLDTVVADYKITVSQLRSSPETFIQAYKYYSYIEAGSDPFAEILDSLLKVKKHVSSTELTREINIKMLEIESLVKSQSHHLIQVQKKRIKEENMNDDLSEHATTDQLQKFLQIVGSLQKIFITAISIAISLRNIHNKDIFTQVISFIIYAVLIYFAYDFIQRRAQDFTQVNRDFHAQVTNLANKNMDLIAKTISTKHNPNSRIDYLWQNSKRFLQKGIDQLTSAPNELQLSLPQSEINLEQLKKDWNNGIGIKLKKD